MKKDNSATSEGNTEIRSMITEINESNYEESKISDGDDSPLSDIDSIESDLDSEEEKEDNS